MNRRLLKKELRYNPDTGIWVWLPSELPKNIMGSLLAMHNNRRHYEFKVIVDESIFGEGYGPMTNLQPYSTVTAAFIFPIDNLEGAEKIKDTVTKALSCPGRSVTVVLAGLST